MISTVSSVVRAEWVLKLAEADGPAKVASLRLDNMAMSRRFPCLLTRCDGALDTVLKRTCTHATIPSLQLHIDR